MQRPKTKSYQKNSTLKQPFLAGGCFILISAAKVTIKYIFIVSIGGAAGHCPRVRKVTDYPSTNIV
jgi:hypothetical protein